MRKFRNTREVVNNLAPKYARGRVLVLNREQTGKYRDCFKKYALEFFEGDADLTGFDDGSVDMVIFLEMIEHLKDYREMAFQIKRILPTGGRCICSAPFLIAKHDDDYWRFTLEGLREVFEREGFKILEADYYGRFFLAIEELFRFLWFGPDLKNKWARRLIRRTQGAANFFDKKIKNKNIYTNCYVVAEKL